MMRKQRIWFFSLIALFGCVSISYGQIPTTTDSADSKGDGLVALNAFLKANMYPKGAYEKTTDYDAKIEGLLSQKVIGDLTGKSAWTYDQPLRGCYFTTKYDPNSELAEITLSSSYECDTGLLKVDRDLLIFGKVPTSYDVLTGHHTPLHGLLFHGDFSNLSGVTSSNGVSSLMRFRVSPDEARDLGLAERWGGSATPLVLRLTFVPKHPYRTRSGRRPNSFGDVIYGGVEHLALLSAKTGKLYFSASLPPKTPDTYKRKVPNKPGASRHKRTRQISR